jgi:hypothetical protein
MRVWGKGVLKKVLKSLKPLYPIPYTPYPPTRYETEEVDPDEYILNPKL